MFLYFLKGNNILCDTNGNIKLCDFGASKFMQEIATTNLKSRQFDTFIGTCKTKFKSM